MPELNDQELLRYSRHILLPEVDISGQERLLNARVLIIGAGGLGSPVALYLASAGVGQVSIADNDLVELSNLQRQIAHNSLNLGMNKAKSAAQRLGELNPDVKVVVLSERLLAERLMDLVSQQDVVVDCCDNFVTRHAINAACVSNKIPLVSGAAVRFSGQLAVYDARNSISPCYACIFPEQGEAADGPCATFGVLAPLVGVIGSLQAVETLKLLVGLPVKSGVLTFYDALDGTFNQVRAVRDPNCTVCGHSI